MAKASLLILKVLIVLVSCSWVLVWLLKPTQLWTKKWRGAEESANTTVFGYNGLDFAVYTFPVIAVAIIGFLYMEMKSREPRTRKGKSSLTSLSNPVLVNTYIGVLSTIEIIAITLFVLLLAWTFYTRISKDFKKMKMPGKSFHLNAWQFKFFRMATRCGLLAEVCLALLLLPILRGLAVFRLLGIQFEASVKYHIWLGTSMIFFATLHGAGTFFIWGIKHHIQDEMWKWQRTNRIYLAGEISLISGLIIWITSLPQVRRTRFEIFYYTHHLYAVFLLFFLFHGGDRHFYMVFAGIFLFGIDKLLRIIQSRPVTCVLSARLFPCKAVELVLPKDTRLKYSPTSIIFLKIPNLSEFQWHSFSISSSSTVDHNTMSVIIKSDGRWTNSLYNLIQSEPDAESDIRKCIPVAIEGPYGPASMDFLRYESLLLVAGGIGITPFLSILQEIVAAQSSGGNNFPSRIQLIYSVKKCQDLSLLNVIVPLLRDQKGKHLHIKIKAFVTQEVRPNATFSELITEVSQLQMVDFDTKDSSYAICGPENLLWTATITAISSLIFLFFLSLFNHLFLNKTPSKQKGPTSVTDLLLLCSFVISLICTTVMASTLRFKKLRNSQLEPSYNNKQEKGMRRSSTEINRVLEEHEIRFGTRTDFEDVFSKIGDEMSGSNIGVYVCGPETMKESVASFCKMNFQGSKKKACFSFHSLNFTL